MNNIDDTIIILQQLVSTNRTFFICLQNRPRKYMFGTNNYGEITGSLNKADGDPWDVIVPGYHHLDINIKYKLKSIDGIILLNNGNHKLIIDVYTDSVRCSYRYIREEIYRYRRKYSNICRIYGYVILDNNMKSIISKLKSFYGF